MTTAFYGLTAHLFEFLEFGLWLATLLVRLCLEKRGQPCQAECLNADALTFSKISLKRLYTVSS